MADLTLPEGTPVAVEYKISELAPPYDTVWAMYYDPDSKVPLYLERAGVRYSFVRADAKCETCRWWSDVCTCQYVRDGSTGHKAWLNVPALAGQLCTADDFACNQWQGRPEGEE